MAGASTVFDQWIQSRDGRGNIKKLVDMPLTSATQSQDFIYSERSELKSASLSGRVGAYGVLSYAYNSAGDRSSATRGTTTTNYSYVGFKLNNLKQSGASVPLREYIYTANESRPVEVIEPSGLSWKLGYFRGGLGTGLLDGLPSFRNQYSYDGLARRVFREQPMNRVSVQEFWDVDGKLLSEIGYNSIIEANPRPVFDYVYLGGEPVALLTATWDSAGVGPVASVSSGGPLVNGAAYGLHGNHLGATLKATDATQTVVFSAEYEPFGRAVTTGTLNLGSRLPGQFDDLPSTSGPDSFHPIYNGSRIYDSSTGRYLQPELLLEEPLWLQIHCRRGQGMPAYSYALNNPVFFSDQTGLDVSVCSRTADIPVGRQLGVKHTWIRTDSVEAGMGPAGGGVPGVALPGQENAQPDSPYVTETSVNDHTGQSTAPGSSCEKVDDVDEACVNRLLQIGRRTGRWSLVNQCQSFTNDVLTACRKNKKGSARQRECFGNKC